ncbi:MAG: prenyltransferase [Myxococcales bacterium]|nr:prenyltransferase [Myxococcales bacterium]
MAAWLGGVIDWERYVLGQAAVTAFQWMTHYANDYFDYEADVANKTPTAWSGGSRVLAEGGLPRRVALYAALVLATIGVMATILVGREEPRAIAVVVPMAVLAWAYSGPPLRLCARGLGELATAIVVTGLVPLLGFVMQAPALEGAGYLGLALAPLVLLQLAMLIAIELPDAEGDEAAGKRTLVVRYGAPWAVQSYALLTTLAYLAVPVGALLGLPTRVVIAATLPAPIAAWRLSRAAADAKDGTYAPLAGSGVMLLMGTAVCELAAFATLVSW